MIEKEFCLGCKQDTDHSVEHLIMKNGLPYRKGKCVICGFGPRALPLNTVKASDNVFYFGKYKGQKFKDVPQEYLEWVLENCTDLNHSTRSRIEQTIDEIWRDIENR